MKQSQESGAPPGFVLREKDRARLWIREDYQDALLSLPVDQPARLAANNPAPLSGRGIIGLIEIQKSKEQRERLIVRPYLRGGLIGHLLHDRYFDPQRAINELQLYEEAHKRGIPTLEVLGAVTRSCRGLGYRHGIITRYLEDVKDLGVVLTEITDVQARRAAMRAAGRVIRVMHEQGFDHPDLNIKNILVRLGDKEASVKAWIIDFDQGHFVDGPLPQKARETNLLRLLRSFVKFDRRQSGMLNFRDPIELAHGYFENEREQRLKFLDEARRALKSSLRIRITSWRSRPDKS